MWICKRLKKHCFSLSIRHFRPIALLRCRREYFLFFPNFSSYFLGGGAVGIWTWAKWATQIASVATSKVSGDVATNIAVAQACILQRQWTRAAELYLLAFALVVLAPWADCLSSQDLCFSKFLHMMCDGQGHIGTLNARSLKLQSHFEGFFNRTRWVDQRLLQGLL